jgi:ribosome maturation factor RimP
MTRSHAARSPLVERLTRVLVPVVADQGLVLERLEVATVGRRRVVRVVVDLPDDAVGAADLDAVAAASRAVSRTLDDLEAGQRPAALGEGPYALEVTTPGVDRPLVERRHWSRARTRLVRVSLTDGGTVLGRVLGVDDEGIRIEVDGTSRTVAWGRIVRGRVEVEFGRPVSGEDLGEDGDQEGGGDRARVGDRAVAIDEPTADVRGVTGGGR